MPTLKTPQDYWEQVRRELPEELVTDGIDYLMRVTFYLGMAMTVDFIKSIAEVEERGKAFENFVDLINMQREIEVMNRGELEA
jgi:hypothetical protein